MWKRICLILLISVISSYLWARSSIQSGSGHVGNGGDVVFCKSGAPFSIELLDLYEAQYFQSSYQVDLSGSTLSEKVDSYLEKLAKHSPLRSKTYREAYKDFFKQIFWVKDGVLVDIPDSSHLVLPKNCELKQIAIQINDESIPNKKYIIDKNLWDQLGLDSKVALIFHEIIYTEALANGHENSRKVRKLNSWILSTEFQNVQSDEFNLLLSEMNFPLYRLNANYPDLFFKVRYGSYGVVTHDSVVPIAGQELRVPQGVYVSFAGQNRDSLFNISSAGGSLLLKPIDIEIDGIKFQFTRDEFPVSSISFHIETDMPNKLECIWERRNEQSVKYPSRHGVINLKPCDLEFNNNGKVGFAKLDGVNQIDDPRLSPDAIFIENELEFHRNGSVKKIEVKNQVRIPYNNQYILTALDTIVEFDQFNRVRELFTKDVLDLEFAGQRFSVSEILTFENSHLISGFPTPGQSFSFWGVSLPFGKGGWISAKEGIGGFAPGIYSFSIKNGSIECVESEWSLYVDSENNLEGCQDGAIELTLFGQKISIPRYSNANVEVYSNRQLKSLKGLWDLQDTIDIPVRGKSYKARLSLEFFKTGEISSFLISEDGEFESRRGSVIRVSSGDRLEFDKQGYLIKVNQKEI